jgi:hypothetical protein
METPWHENHEYHLDCDRQGHVESPQGGRAGDGLQSRDDWTKAGHHAGLPAGERSTHRHRVPPSRKRETLAMNVKAPQAPSSADQVADSFREQFPKPQPSKVTSRIGRDRLHF